MSLGNLLPYAQIVISIILIVLILLQRSEAGLGGAFGGDDGFSQGQRTKRGFERTLFRATILFAILLPVSVLLAFFL